MVNISPIAKGRLERIDKTFLGTLLKYLKTGFPTELELTCLFPLTFSSSDIDGAPSESIIFLDMGLLFLSSLKTFLISDTIAKGLFLL